MFKTFQIEEEKIDLFKEFSKVDVKYNNTFALIDFHHFEYEKTKSEYNLNKIKEYNLVLKGLIKERADILHQLTNSYYNYEFLNNGSLLYHYSFIGKELTIYQ